MYLPLSSDYYLYLICTEPLHENFSINIPHPIQVHAEAEKFAKSAMEDDSDSEDEDMS